MLALSRKVDERIVIGDNIAVHILHIKGDHVRIGIEAPADVKIYRGELYDAIAAENATARAIPADISKLGGLPGLDGVKKK